MLAVVDFSDTSGVGVVVAVAVDVEDLIVSREVVVTLALLWVSKTVDISDASN